MSRPRFTITSDDEAAKGIGERGITFGFFNNLAKLTPDVSTLSARVLLAVPVSRVMLKTELVVDTPEDYVTLAARLAGGLDWLAALRAGLRERMASSPLTDAKRFTLNLERAYCEMWTKWCGRSQNEAR